MLEQDFRAIDWSPDGSYIIIGTMNGLIYYVDTATMKCSEPFKSLFFSSTEDKK